MKDKKILVYGDNYYRQMGKKNIDQLQPSDMIRLTHLPDVYEFMSMVETAMCPFRLESCGRQRCEIVENHRLLILDRRACRTTDSNSHCWAPVFVGDAGMTAWHYDQFLDKDDRVFKFLPDKNKKYREAALWNRRRVQAILSGKCIKPPTTMDDGIGDTTYWCLLGELVILNIAMGTPTIRVSFESDADVPKCIAIAHMQKGTTGSFVYLDSTILCPGKALKNFSYEDLLQPVYIRFDPEVVESQKPMDLHFRSYENWKATVEAYGLNLYWR